jgi:DNA mismatch repair ATPase MutS
MDKSLTLDYSKRYGWFFQVAKKHEKTIKEHSQFHQIDTIKKSGFKFRDALSDRLSDAYQKAVEAYEETQKSIVEEVMKVASESFFALSMITMLVSYVEPAEESSNLIAELDVYVR